MRAARLTSFDSPLIVETVEEPKLIPGSVIIRVLSVFIPSYTSDVFRGILGKLTAISLIILELYISFTNDLLRI